MKKSLLIGALTLASFSMAFAKTYDIVLSNSAKVGSVELKAGEYKVKMEGSNAVFTNVQTSEKFTAPAKLENTGKKHDYTAVQSTTQNGTDHIQAIELGGSQDTLEFSE